MNVNFGPAVVFIFILFITEIFSTFFSARLAQLKMRSRAWGMLGFFLNVLGLAIVCFLRSKRSDKMQTNPIAHAISKLPAMSRKTIGLLAGIAIAAILTLVAYDNLPTMIQNYKYSKQVLKQNESEYEQPRLINDSISSISTGTNTTYAVSDSANVYCWGEQFLPHIEGEDRGLIYKKALKIASCGSRIAVLTDANELYFYDTATGEKTNFNLISKSVSDFSMSETTLGYIKSNSKLYMLGDNSYGQLGSYDFESKSEPVAVLGNVSKVVCEATFTVVLQKNGNAVAFGSNAYGQLPSEEAKLASPLELLGDIKDIAAGDDFILLLTNNGKVMARGNNSCGQLGTANTQSLATFTNILSDMETIYAAKRSAYALSTNGSLYAWGQNNVGQLGNGSTENVLEPVNVANDVLQVSVSGLHTVILTNNHKISATGCNSHRQLGKGSFRDTFSEVVAIRS